jgi:hypothetical protein
MNLMPQDITEVQDFLAEQEVRIMGSVSALQSKAVISLVFAILRKELDCELAEAGNRMETAGVN